MESNKLQLDPTQQAIIKTLLYSDIFYFPLSKEELWQFLLTDKKIDRGLFEHSLEKLSEHVAYKNGFYCLVGKEKNIERRIKNLPEVQKKLKIARAAAYYISYIPTIHFIGLSGSLACGNAKEDDDIDFFIITKKNTLFVTRLWVLALLEVMHLRRKRSEKNVANKICVNLLLDETRLPWPSRKRDIYIAHEIGQLQPLFERNSTYHTFLKKNAWIEKFLPNYSERQAVSKMKNWRRNYFSLKVIAFIFSSKPIEYLMGVVQKGYMRRHKARDLIKNNLLAFHPNDYRFTTLQLLKKKYQQLGLLTNN